MEDWLEQSNSQPNRDILPIKLFHRRYSCGVDIER